MFKDGDWVTELGEVILAYEIIMLQGDMYPFYEFQDEVLPIEKYRLSTEPEIKKGLEMDQKIEHWWDKKNDEK